MIKFTALLGSIFFSLLIHAQNEPMTIIFEGDNHGFYFNEANNIFVSNTVTVSISGLLSSPHVLIRPNTETVITITALEEENYSAYKMYDVLSGGTTTITSRGTGGTGRIGDEMKNFTFYPNPTKDIIVIESDLYDMVDYSLFDYSGNLLEKNLLHNRKKQIVNLENYKNGHYILEINFKNNQKKIIKIIKK